MPTVTLRPNGTVSNDGTVVGGGTAHGAMSDDSDSTYVSFPAPDAEATFELGTFTLGTDRVKTITQRARGRAGSGSGFAQVAVFVPGGSKTTQTLSPFPSSFTERAAAPVAMSLSQSDINALRIQFNGDSDASELYVDVLYATQPVVAITAPTGDPTITDTNRPTITWDYTPGDDGGSQFARHLRVFTAAQVAAGGFNPDTTPPVYRSDAFGSGTSHTLTEPLDNNESYVVFVQAAQIVNGQGHWSAWDSEPFSVDVDTADVDAVTAVGNDDNARITVTVERDATSEAWDFVEVERSVAGGPWEFVRGASYVDAIADADTFVIVDHETPNGVFVHYRARATRILAGLPITGAWVQTVTHERWRSPRSWLKTPHDPAVNMAVVLFQAPSTHRGNSDGVFHPIGSSTNIVVADTLHAGDGVVIFHAQTPQEAAAIETLLERRFLLLQHPTAARNPHRYIVARTIDEVPVGRRFPQRHHRLAVMWTGIDRPPDLTP